MFEWHTPIEIMKDGTVREYKGYLINRNGKLYSLITKQFKTASFDNGNYKFYTLSLNGKKLKPKVHKLVLSTFNPAGYNKKLTNECDHIDENKINNNINNLRWVTRSQNQSKRSFRDNQSMPKYVQHDEERNMYYVVCSIKNEEGKYKSVYVGSRKCIKEAIQIRDEFFLKYGRKINCKYTDDKLF